MARQPTPSSPLRATRVNLIFIPCAEREGAYNEPTQNGEVRSSVTPEEELTIYIEDIDAFSKRFVKGSTLYLNTGDQAIFKGKIIAVTARLDELFGNGNTYTNNIIHTVNEGSGGFFGGPSLACVKEVVEIVKAARTKLARDRAAGKEPEKSEQTDNYVDVVRIEELQSINNTNFDLTRLIRLCEELNIAHKNRCYMAIAMIVRAIIDHVPPILSCTNFGVIPDNYKGSKSFKEQMRHLDQSLRNVADTHLHVQVRQKESLPTFTQVDFRADIDALLSEIIRLLLMKKRGEHHE
jgi:hypothetical protein